MDKATFFAVMVTICATAATLACIYAAIHHPVKRWLWVITAVMCGYFGVNYFHVATGTISALAIVSLLVRPALGPLLLIVAAHAILDSRRRPPS